MNYKHVLLGLLISTLAAGCHIQKRFTINNNIALIRAQQTLDSLYLNYSVPGTFLLRENYPSSTDNDKVTYLTSKEQKDMPNRYSYLWPYSGTFSAITALYVTTQDTTYKSLLDNRVLVGLEEYLDNRRVPEAYASYIHNAAQSDRFYDDNIWLGIDFTDIYSLSKEAKYLQKAQLIWKFIESGMDDKLGGGIYWCEQKQKSKNTCSNAPASVLALKLFQVTKDKSYLEKGIRLYEWTKTHLQDTIDFLYFDNIDLNGKISKAKFAYNSGQMIQASTLLYQLTKQKKYLTDAQNIAKECHNYFFMEYTPENGKTLKLIRKGDIWFTAVMLRGFIELYHTDKNKTYLNAFNQSLDYAWEHARDEKGLFNTDFTGNTQDNKRWLLTQAAMVEMYARLAAIQDY